LRKAQNGAPVFNFAWYTDSTSDIVLQDFQKIRVVDDMTLFRNSAPKFLMGKGLFKSSLNLTCKAYMVGICDIL